MKCWRKDLVTHLVGLSELESISIDDGEGARDKWRREDNFPLKDPVILRMRFVSDGFLLEMMIVGWEICCVLYKFALPTVNTSDGSWYQTLHKPEPVGHEALTYMNKCMLKTILLHLWRWALEFECPLATRVETQLDEGSARVFCRKISRIPIREAPSYVAVGLVPGSRSEEYLIGSYGEKRWRRCMYRRRSKRSAGLRSRW